MSDRAAGLAFPAAVMGFFAWLRGKRSRPIPDELWQCTVAGLPFLAARDAAELARLKQLAEEFLGEKEFTAAGGLELSDEICVAIAAQGCLPILNLGLAAYRGWVGIVVYPDEFVAPREIEDANGLVHEFDDVLSGEAWPGGPLLVSWHDVRLAGDGYNVVIHEFAHKLDMLNGESDGIPALHSGIASADWEAALLAAYDDFCARVDSGEETRIDPYASDSPAEFFAVLSECFFDLPDLFAAEYPALYALFCRYYRQNPGRR
ncbi:MAG: zinc-dependent peptidase [Betaproteobacteria bacterium]|nr:zinc-dependent peptidase [Betaproteobacteria bacterium]MCL2887096.1 zinc-dependent peptidase [Betaproteobacteria bacterium]